MIIDLNQILSTFNIDYEIAKGNNKVGFEYQPLATFGESGITAPAYAVTKHYDIQHQIGRAHV